jgi:hypothetical protein
MIVQLNDENCANMYEHKTQPVSHLGHHICNGRASEWMKFMFNIRCTIRVHVDDVCECALPFIDNYARSFYRPTTSGIGETHPI